MFQIALKISFHFLHRVPAELFERTAREGERDHVLGGNTGALMASSRLILRMAGDLDRPAIVAAWLLAVAVFQIGRLFW